MPKQPEKIVLDIHEYAILTHLIIAKGPKGRVFNPRKWYVYNLCRFELCELDGRYIRITEKGRDMFLWHIEWNYRGDKTSEYLKLGVLKMHYNVTYKMNFDLIYRLWLKGQLP